MTNRTQIEFEMPDLTDNDPAAEAVLRELADVHQPMSWTTSSCSPHKPYRSA